MGSSIKWLFALGVGVVGGWALRSLSDTPEGAGVKLLEVGIKTKNRLASWAAVERERFDDMLAEAQSNIASESAAASTSGRESATSKRRDGRTAKRESSPGGAPQSNVTGFNS